MTKQMVHDQVMNACNPLHVVWKYLFLFFERNESKIYFLRLSTISPKDARIYLDEDGDEEDDDLKDIMEDIQQLKVGVAVQETAGLAATKCVQLLCHSERVKYEIQLTPDLEAKRVSLLLDWKNVSIPTETRCYVHEWRLVALSQYYVNNSLLAYKYGIQVIMRKLFEGLSFCLFVKYTMYNRNALKYVHLFCEKYTPYLARIMYNKLSIMYKLEIQKGRDCGHNLTKTDGMKKQLDGSQMVESLWGETSSCSSECGQVEVECSLFALDSLPRPEV